MGNDSNKTRKSTKTARRAEGDYSSKESRSSSGSRRHTSRRQGSESRIQQRGGGDDSNSLRGRRTGHNLISSPRTEPLAAAGRRDDRDYSSKEARASARPRRRTSRRRSSELSIQQRSRTDPSDATKDFIISPRKSRSRRRSNNGTSDAISPSRSSPISIDEQTYKRAIDRERRKSNEMSRKIELTPNLGDKSPNHSIADSTESNELCEPTHQVKTLASRETNNCGSQTDGNKKKTKKPKKTESTFDQGFVSCSIRVGWLVSCIIGVLVAGGVVAYFVATSESTMPAPSDPTFSPSASLPMTPNPSVSPQSSLPSSYPTMGFLFDPPLPEDCDRVRNGEAVLAQDLLAEQTFDVILDVTMGVPFGPTEIMDLLELKIQKHLIPKLVGCDEATNRKLRHGLVNPNRYIVGNGKVQWLPVAVHQDSECSFRMCFSATFNMDLFLKTAEVKYFIIMNLFADIFGGDLVDSLQLQSPPFISVVVRSVLNKNPTMAPSSTPSLIPSADPSQKTSEMPSNVPTLEPTMTPTQGPTYPPTPRPTLPPTVAPTPIPSTAPTLAPTLHPTLALTLDPTPTPTRSPTMAPSQSPSTTSGPTGEMDGYFQPLDRPIRVACAGDSLTVGTFGGLPIDTPYPFQLQQMLGESFEVFNFGRNSVTALRGLSVSYVDTAHFQASLNVEPDIYLLMLGHNDAKYGEVHEPKFRTDMEWMVNQVRTISAESPPRIIIGIPPWVKTDAYGIRNDVLVSSVQPAIETLAALEDLQLVDLYDVTYNQGDSFIGDGLHLNKKGYRSLAAAWEVAILCNNNRICETGENCSTCPGDCYLNC